MGATGFTFSYWACGVKSAQSDRSAYSAGGSVRIVDIAVRGRMRLMRDQAKTKRPGTESYHTIIPAYQSIEDKLKRGR